jgi:tetratricopeptide (TPR) repeat protein
MRSMDRPDFPPSKGEVLEQLRIVLESPRFKNAQNPSELLKLGVERAVDGKKTTGNIIGKTIFGASFDQYTSPDVRVTASNLRKTLKNYYEREGAYDLILFSYPEPQADRSIRLAEGEAYTPRYVFNPENDLLKVVRIAYSHLDKVTCPNYVRAFSLFKGILANDPDHVEGNLGMALTLLSFSNWGWTNPDESDPEAECKAIFAQIQDKADEYWRLWATRAYFAEGKDNVDAAATFYDRALALSKSATEGFFPYIWFLVQSGKTDSALILGMRYFDERLENADVAALYGMLLVQAGRYEMGVKHLEMVLNVEPYNLIAHQILAVLRFSERNIEQVTQHLKVLKEQCDVRAFFPLVRTLESSEEQFDLKGCIAKILSS